MQQPYSSNAWSMKDLDRPASGPASNRLRDAGFEVRIAGAGEIASTGEAAPMEFAGIADNVYHCVKTD